MVVYLRQLKSCKHTESYMVTTTAKYSVKKTIPYLAFNKGWLYTPPPHSHCITTPFLFIHFELWLLVNKKTLVMLGPLDPSGWGLYHQCASQLIDEMSYPSMFADVVKQLASRHVLHDHEEICGCTYHLVPKIQSHICTDMNLLHIHWHFSLFNVVIHKINTPIIGFYLISKPNVFIWKHAQNKCAVRWG